MSFLHPQYLYYFLPLLVVLLVFIFRKKEAEYSFFTKEIIDKLRVNSNALSLKQRNIFIILALACFVIGFAEPIIKEGTVEVKSKSADIMLALDISDSMLAEDVYPNRLKFAKQKALELLKQAPDERIGVIGFAKNSYLVSPMSFDHDAVGFLLRQLNTDSITEKGTDFISLLDVVNTTIKTEAKKYLLVISDGGDKESFKEEIDYAKENNIVVFILGVGTKKGAPIKKDDGSFIKYKGEIIVSKLNENIADFATKTGGVYIQSVKSLEDIQTMLQEIENISDQKDLKSETINKFIPLFYYPVGLALLLLLIAFSSFSRKPAMVVAFLSVFSLNQDAKAGVLDFVDLYKAKEAYNQGEFSKSSSLYEKFADESNDPSAQFNKANALYKQEKYDEAIESYKNTKFEDKLKQANNLANLGNSYVKQAGEGALEKAVEAYEESLALNEDEQVRENLENVKKELEKQKQQEEQNKENQENKEQQDNQENQEENKEGSDNQDKQNNKQENEDQKQQDNKDKKEQENQEKNEQNKDDLDDLDNSKDKEQKNKQDKSKEQDEKNAEDEKKDKSQENKKEDLKELEEKRQEEKLSGVSQAAKQDEMSDEEERKWLKQLNDKQGTFLYMLNQNNEEDLDEKPW